MAKEPPGFSEKQLHQFERQMAQHGSASLEKSRASLEERLVEHEEKLEAIRDAGGYTSSVEREIRNFLQQIEAIDYLLEVRS